MVKRGEIYLDYQFTYRAGNTEDKFLIILNKNYLPKQPVIVTPCTSNKANRNYNPGCNHRSSIFYLRANEDFFEKNTIVELFIVESIDEAIFEGKRSKRIIERYSSLQAANLQRLVGCLKDLKEDIRQELHPLLF